MTIKLKPGCRYECDPSDWRKVAVVTYDGLAIAQVAPDGDGDGGEVVKVHHYCDGGSRLGSDAVPCLIPENWEYRAHSELTVRGWFSPWEVVC